MTHAVCNLMMRGAQMCSQRCAVNQLENHQLLHGTWELVDLVGQSWPRRMAIPLGAGSYVHHQLPDKKMAYLGAGWFPDVSRLRFEDDFRIGL